AAGRGAVDRLGLSVRRGRKGARGSRYESCFKAAGETLAAAARIAGVVDMDVRCVARLGRRDPSTPQSASLPFTPACSVRPGMVMFTEDGGYDVVESVELVELDAPVYDLNVEHTPNFIAGHLIT